jgi:phage shock protein A
MSDTSPEGQAAAAGEIVQRLRAWRHGMTKGADILIDQAADTIDALERRVRELEEKVHEGIRDGVAAVTPQLRETRLRAEAAEARVRELEQAWITQAESNKAKDDTIWGLKQFNKAIGKHAEKSSPKIMTRLRFCAAHGSCPDGAPTPEEMLTVVADLERQIDEANSENDNWLTAVGSLTERAEAAEARVQVLEAERDGIMR